MAPRVSPKQERDWFFATAAELRALQLFTASFLRRYPGGEVLSQLDYHTIRHTRKPELNRVLDALKQDFANRLTLRGYRKPDGLGITKEGGYAELMEVKTVNGKHRGEVQLRDMLEILHGPVNRNWALHTMWTPTNWRPVGPQELYFAVYQRVIISFEPTYREAAPPGLILYEVIDLREKQEVPVPLSREAADAVRKRVVERPIKQEGPVGWAEAFGRDHPILMAALKAICLILGATLTIIGLILIIDPVPGDEVLALSAAAALLAFANEGSVPAAHRSL